MPGVDTGGQWTPQQDGRMPRDKRIEAVRRSAGQFFQVLRYGKSTMATGVRIGIGWKGGMGERGLQPTAFTSKAMYANTGTCNSSRDGTCK